MDNREDFKPKNLTVHEFLTRKTAVRTMIPESIVEKILTHEKKSALKAFHNYNEVELSGFGKFSLSQVKLRNRMSRMVSTIFRVLQKCEKTDRDWNNIASFWEDLEYYKTKIKPDENRPEGYQGGAEEYLLPSQRSKRGDQESARREARNMQDMPILLAECRSSGIQDPKS